VRLAVAKPAVARRSAPARPRAAVTRAEASKASEPRAPASTEQEMLEALASPVPVERERPASEAFLPAQIASEAAASALSAAPASRSAPRRWVSFRRARLRMTARHGACDEAGGFPANPSPRRPSAGPRRRPCWPARQAHWRSRRGRRSRRSRFASHRWCASASGPRDTQGGTTTHRPCRHRMPNSAWRRSWSGHRPQAAAAVPGLSVAASALPLPALPPADWELGRGRRRPPERRHRGRR
jgi:hypothetical protein